MVRIEAIGKIIRPLDTFPFCGIALLGVLLGGDAEVPQYTLAMLCVVTSTFFLSAFAFTFNDLQDVEYDRQASSKSGRPLVQGSLSIGSAKFICVLMAAIGITLLVIGSSWQALAIGISTIPVSILYSWRRFPLKTTPVLSTLTHLVFGAQIFTLGAWSVSNPDPMTPVIGAYFGLVFAAGHLHHEVLDVEADRNAGVRTHAVRFGARATLLAGFLLWSLSCAHFTVLALFDIVPRMLGWIQAGMFLGYLIAFFAVLKGKHYAESLERLQKVYRGVYFTGGVLMAAAIFYWRL